MSNPKQLVQRKKFFDSVRPMFGGKLSDGQVEGLIAIINEFERRDLSDTRWLAYILATVFHESEKTMQPIEEDGKGRGRKYGKKFRITGKPYDKPDIICYGRGLVQVTWLDNYERFTRAAVRNGHNWDFVNHPELLLQMQPSVWVTFHGMIHGMFTGKGLPDYFDTDTTDWINARHIINRLDRATLIAGYAEEFYAAILLMPPPANLN